MQGLDSFVTNQIEVFYKPVETYWQPSDILPDASDFDGFVQRVRELQAKAKELPYDLLAVLIGDTITEEALPTYESHLFSLEGMNDNADENPWRQWSRMWTAEENRHGDLLNRYLYLSGRVNMKAMEQSVQHLISDGFDIQTANDPYRTFVYTSFQEVATQISHRRVGTLSKQAGDDTLARICALIAADEARHAKMYQGFVEKIFTEDPSEMMIAFADMMKKKIIMPAHFLREVEGLKGSVYEHFSDAAQRIGVYTAQDYIDILTQISRKWNLETVTSLTSEAEKARDFILKLPVRLARVAERLQTPSLEYQFSWIR